MISNSRLNEVEVEVGPTELLVGDLLMFTNFAEIVLHVIHHSGAYFEVVVLRCNYHTTPVYTVSSFPIDKNGFNQITRQVKTE